MRVATRFAAAPALLLALIAAAAAAIPEATDAIRVQVDAGRLLYAGACANCHGAAGKGAIGPALADRDLTAELIRGTVLNGRVGTPMPPFKDDLDSKSLAQVLAYVQSITSAGRLPTAVVSTESPSGAGTGTSEPSSQPVAVGTEHGVAARGAELFFDPTRIGSCRTCHSYANKGGPVGPDLSNDHKTRLQVLQCLTHPRLAAAAFPTLSLQLRDGTRVIGIASEETADFIRVFDVGSLPPVRRSLRKSDVKSRATVTDSGVYDHAELHYTRQELLDLSAFLGR